MGRVGTAAAIGALALAAGAAAAARSDAREATVGCGGTAARGVGDMRVVLGAVALPTGGAVARPARRTAGWPWRYFRSASLAIRAGERDVALAVPEGWRNRVAISWSSSAAASRIRFVRCAGPAGTWLVYSGGFHLARRGDCVPIVVRVGGTSTTVRLGVGRRCGRS